MKAKHAVSLLALLLASVPGLARSQTPDATAAEAVFTEGRGLMKDGRYAEACPKFELSLRLERAPGTEANLAECYVKLGKTASAWLHYREAAALSQQAGQAARASEARERASKLEPSLCRLILRAPAKFPPNAVVRRDGAAVDPALFGTRVPVDPGEHVVEASVPTVEPITKRATIKPPEEGASCGDTVIDLPELPFIEPPPPPPPPIVAPPPPLRPTPEPVSSARKTLGFVIGGVGIAAVAVGAGFGIDAIGKKNGADCTDLGCSSTGQEQRRSAGSSADVATVALIAGAALAATGVVLILTAPSAKHDVGKLHPGRWQF